MSRLAKYEIESLEKEKEIIKQKKDYDHYSRVKRYNKCSDEELLIEVMMSVDVSDYLHLTNNHSSWSIIQNNRKDSEYISLLKIIISKSKNFLVKSSNAYALSIIKFYYLFKLNDIETWEPKRNDPIKQLYSIIDHLFCKYEVPKFLYKGFYNDQNSNRNSNVDHKMIELLIHIGSGESFKKFKQAPKLKLNNKVYHHLFTTPEGISYFEAFRRAQILSMGGDECLVNTFLDSRLKLSDSENNDEFWVSVIQFFVSHPMVEPLKVKEILDYINNQKYQRRYINNVWENPVQPNFSMKGRTVDSLIRSSDEWHKIQAQAATRAPVIRRGYTPVIRDYKWIRSDIKGYNYNSSNNKDFYDIIEMLSSEELRDLSHSQRNCVYSYASSCADGRCKIFTLRLNREPLLTIEVRGYSLVQIKGKANTNPKESEMRHVRRWADNERLNIK
jgi:hypothetical protein